VVQPATGNDQHEGWLLVAEDQSDLQSMNGSGLRIYALLAQLSLPKSYLGKIMLSAFLGTHVPLVALVIYLVFATSADLRFSLTVLGVVLVATLLGTAATLYALYALLRPVSLVSESVCDYLDNGDMPSLPTGFADQAGKLMANVQYVIEQLDEVIRSLEETAVKDHLTSAYNRRAGEQRLAGDLARVGRGEGTLTLALVDLDKLKAINDRYGHQAGDRCLRHVADTFLGNIREGDWVARWGGDEFVVGLWEEKGDRKANLVLDRITEELADNPVELSQGDMLRLTYSAGVVRCTTEEDAELGTSGVLALADEALYKAKEAGEESTFVNER
jgi:diguanylate cyclase (GGDEF)-like protein